MKNIFTSPPSWLVLLPLLLATLLFSSCGNPPPSTPATTTQPRIASLAPSITEIVAALGASDQLVGRSSACDYPPDLIASLPIVGDFGVPSMERLLATRPSLVLYTDLADLSIPTRLTNLGLTPIHIPCTTLTEIAPAIRTVGQLLGRQSLATQLADTMESRIADLRRQLPPSDQRPRVLVLIWNDPLTAAGNKSFLTELITLAGGQNVADTIQRDYFQVSGEWVVSRNPDVIFCFFMASDMPARELIMKQSGWSNINAVRTGRVYAGLDNNLILRPGPRMIQGVEAIQKCLRESNDKP
jgi:iron complex transport system substrate-binding protein